MTTNKYRGRRYVPLIEDDRNPWSKENVYEALTVVSYEGNSYTSRKDVPSGIDINNKDFWACTGNYNAQIELYRRETVEAVNNVNNKLDSFSNLQDGKFQIMLNNYKAQINAYADGKYSGIDSDVEELKGKLDTTKNDINTAISNCERNLSNTVENYTNTTNDQLQQINNMISALDLTLDEGVSTDIDSDDITIIDEGEC